MALSRPPNGLNGGPKVIEASGRTNICIPLPPRYVSGSGPPLPPLRLLPQHDSTAFIKDRLLLPPTGLAANGKPLPKRMMYLVGWFDLPAATVLVPAMKVLDYVSPYVLEEWEAKFEQELDDERLRLEVEKQATEAAVAVAAEAVEAAAAAATAVIMKKHRPPAHSNIEAAVVAEPETVAKAKSQLKKGVMMGLSPAKKRLQDFEGLGSDNEDELHRDYEDRYHDQFQNVGAPNNVGKALHLSESTLGRIRDGRMPSLNKMAALDRKPLQQPFAPPAPDAAVKGFTNLLRPPSSSGPGDGVVQDKLSGQGQEILPFPFSDIPAQRLVVQPSKQAQTPIPQQQREAFHRQQEAFRQLQLQDQHPRQPQQQPHAVSGQLTSTNPQPIIPRSTPILQPPQPHLPPQISATTLPDLRYPNPEITYPFLQAERPRPPNMFTPITALAARPASEQQKPPSTFTPLPAKRPVSEEAKPQSTGAKRPASQESSRSAPPAKRKRDPEYYVEGLEDVRYSEDPERGIVRSFKVRWEGDWPPEQKSTWEPESNIPVKMVKVFMSTYEARKRAGGVAAKKKHKQQMTLNWPLERRYSSVTEAFSGAGESVMGPQHRSHAATERDQDEVFVVTEE